MQILIPHPPVDFGPHTGFTGVVHGQCHQDKPGAQFCVSATSGDEMGHGWAADESGVAEAGLHGMSNIPESFSWMLGCQDAGHAASTATEPPADLSAV